MNDKHVELLIRLDEKVDAIREDLKDIQVLEKRVSVLERLASYGKGVAAAFVAGFGYILKMLHLT